MKENHIYGSVAELILMLDYPKVDKELISRILSKNIWGKIFTYHLVASSKYQGRKSNQRIFDPSLPRLSMLASW